MAGYGRGYYGGAQLAQDLPRPRPRSRPRRRNWGTYAALLGVGAATAWMLWPRRSTPEIGPVPGGSVGTDHAAVLTVDATSVPVTGTTAPVPPSVVPVSAFGAFLKQLEDDARARGFISVKDYEDAVVASAKQLQAAGSKVTLAPHLQHLASRLEA